MEQRGSPVVIRFDTGDNIGVDEITDHSGRQFQPDDMLFNPASKDVILETGLDPAAFNTEFEGGLFRVIEHLKISATNAGIKQIQ